MLGCCLDPAQATRSSNSVPFDACLGHQPLLHTIHAVFLLLCWGAVLACTGNWQTSQWLGGDNKYTRFVLLKENMDTQVSRQYSPVRGAEQLTYWERYSTVMRGLRQCLQHLDSCIPSELIGA